MFNTNGKILCANDNLMLEAAQRDFFKKKFEGEKLNY